MTFGPAAIRGSTAELPGAVDYRLLRQSVIADFRKKRLAQHEVCDAHPELVRAAQEVGEPTRIDCPICEAAKVVLVTYVFGARLPPFGRCVTTKAEFAKLDRRPGGPAPGGSRSRPGTPRPRRPMSAPVDGRAWRTPPWW